MKVSIIIPIYNVAPYIEACLQSVFNQTYKDIEIIIIDDCGTDNSMEIAEKIVSAYNGEFCIKILHHNQNKGLSAARNTGIKRATGEYIFFLDSDDTLPNNSIYELIQQAIKYPDVSFVIGGIKTTGYRVYEYPLLSKEYLNKQETIISDYLLHKWNEMACNKLISHKFIIEHKLFFLENSFHEDLDFTFRLALLSKSMACCYTNTYNYLTRKGSITTNKILKNYLDEYNIITNNISLITNLSTTQLSPETITNYIINTCYSYIIHLLKNKNSNIKIKEKKTLTQKVAILSQKSPQKPKGIFIIKKKYIQLPFSLKLFITFIYTNIRKF